MNTEDFQFCKNLPKVELHAHLNGSLSPSCLETLGCPKNDIEQYQKLVKELSNNERSLEECFSIFQIAHSATNNCQAVYIATTRVIEEFANDNVIYLELRTTPRELGPESKQDYIEAVVKAIQNSPKDIDTKLLLSIDRTHNIKDSKNIMKLIIEMKQKYPNIIRGIDLCGNPSKGEFNSDIFLEAVSNGLFTTIHCGEIENITEIEEILKFKPTRIGHGTFLHPQYGGSDENWKLYLNHNIPLECCLTSNILCGTVQRYEDHHVKEWINKSLPFTLCTDDKGLFGTTLSEEYFHAKNHFGLSDDYLWKLSCNAIGYSFANEEEKKIVHKKLEQWKMKNLC